MAEDTLRIGVQVLGREQLRALRQDLLGITHAANQVAKTPIGRIGKELQDALNPFQRQQQAPGIKAFLDGLNRDLGKATGISRTRLKALQVQAKDLANTIGPGALSQSLQQFAKVAEQAMKTADNEIRRIQNNLQSGVLKSAASLDTLRQKLLSIKTPLPKELQQFASSLSRSVDISVGSLEKLAAQAAKMAALAPAGPLKEALETLASTSQSSAVTFEESMRQAQIGARDALYDIVEDIKSLPLEEGMGKLGAHINQLIFPGGKKAQPGPLVSMLRGFNKGIDISASKLEGFAATFEQFAQRAEDEGLDVADTIREIGDAFQQEAAKLRLAPGASQVNIRTELQDVIATVKELSVESQPAAAAVSRVISEMNRTIASGGRISGDTLERLRNQVRNLIREFPDLAARLNPVSAALETLSSKAREATIDSQRLAAATLGASVSGIQELATSFDSLDPRIRGAVDNAIKKILQLDESLNAGRATALSFTSGINATTEALDAMGPPTDDESEAQMRLRSSLQQTNMALKEQQKYLHAAEVQAKRDEAISHGRIVRGRKEAQNLKAFQSVMQGFIMGSSLLQGQLMFAAFSFVFANFVMVRLMLAAAALTIVIGGLQKAFKAVAMEAIKMGSSLVDTIAKLRMVTGSVQETNAAYMMAIQISRKYRLAQDGIISGFTKLHNEGLVTRPLIEGIAKAAAGLGLEFDDVASQVVSAIGREKGSIEGLSEILGIQAFQMGEVANESDRLTRMSLVADALNKKFADAASTRARTLTGALTGLREEAKRLFGILGAPFVQDVLVPLVNGLTSVVQTITDTTRQFFASREAGRLWGEVLNNLRKFMDLLFPTQEKFNDQVKNRTVQVLILLLKFLILTTRALVLLAQALRLAAAAAQKLWGFIKALADALRPLLQILKSLVDPAFLQALKDFFLNLPAAILEGLNNLLEGLDVVLPAILRTLDNFTRSLADEIVPALIRAWDNFLKAFDNVARQLPDLIDSILRALDNLLRGLDNFLKLFAPLVDNFGRLLDNLAGFLRSTDIGGLLDNFLRAIDNVGKSLIDADANYISWVDDFKALWRSLDEFLKPTFESIGRGLDNFFTATDNFAKRLLGLDMDGAIDNIVRPLREMPAGLDEITPSVDTAFDDLFKAFPAQSEMDEIAQSIGTSLDNMIRGLAGPVERASDEVGVSFGRAFLRALGKAVDDIFTGLGTYAVRMLDIPLHLINPLGWPLLIKDAFDIIALPIRILDNLSPSKILATMAEQMGTTSGDLARGVVGFLFNPAEWADAMIHQADSLRGVLGFVFVDIIGSVLIDAVLADNAVFRGVAQVVWGALIGALEGAAGGGLVGGSSAGPWGAVIGALVGALVGALLSLAVELGLNPEFRDAFNEFTRSMGREMSEALGRVGIDLGPFADNLASIFGDIPNQLSLDFGIDVGGIMGTLSSVEGPINGLVESLGNLAGAFATLGQGIADFSTNPAFVFLYEQLDNLATIIGIVLQPYLFALSFLIGTTLRASVEALVDFLNQFIDLLGASLQPAIQIVVGQFNAWASALTMVINIFAGFVSLVGHLLSGDWAAAWNDARGIVQSFVDGVVGIFGGMWQSIAGAAELGWVIVKNVFEGIGQAFWDIFDTAITDTVELFMNLPGRAVTWVEDLYHEVIGWFEDLYNDLVGGSIVPDLCNGIVMWFANLPIRIAEVFLDFISVVLPGWFTTMAAALFGVFTDILENGSKGWKWLWNTMKTFVQGIIGFFTGESDPSIPGFFEKMVTALWGWMTDFLDMEAKGWKAVWETAKSFVEGLAGFFTGDSDPSIPGYFGDMVEALWDWLDEFLNASGKGWKWIWNEAKSFLEGISAFFTNTIPGWFTTMWNEISRIMGDIYGKITGVFSDIKNWIEGVGNIDDFFTSTVPGWFSALYDAVLGSNGFITRFKDEVIGAFEDIADAGVFGRIADIILDPFRDVRDGLQTGLEGVISFANTISGAISDIAGAIGISINGLNLSAPRLPTFAAGGVHAGGLAMLGEQGPELAVLPKGTRVIPNQASMAMLGEEMPAIGGLFGDLVGAVWGSLPDFAKDAISQVFREGAEFLVERVFGAVGVHAPNLTLFDKDMGQGMFDFLKNKVVEAVKDGFSALSGLISAREAERAWQKPLDHYSVSQEFGVTPFSDIYRSGIHTGIDLAAPEGTIVKSAKRGLVSLSSSLPGYGRTVMVAHDERLITLYAHLDQLVGRVGEMVEAGQYIGTVGMTGRTTGPHLHFETQEGLFNAVDPRKYINFALGGLMKAGGFAQVGEQGKELVYLPGGSRVFSQSQSASILAGRNSGPSQIIIQTPITVQGNVVGQGGMQELAETVAEVQAKRLRGATRFDMLRG